MPQTSASIHVAADAVYTDVDLRNIMLGVCRGVEALHNQQVQGVKVLCCFVKLSCYTHAKSSTEDSVTNACVVRHNVNNSWI